MESPVTYFKLLLTSCMMLLTGTLLAIVKKNTSEAPAHSIQWTDVLGSVYNEDRFEKIIGAVDRSTKNFSAMSQSSRSSKYQVTFLPQVHFIERFRSTVDELSIQFGASKEKDFGGFIEQKILSSSDSLEVNQLARILEVYNSQLAIYDHLSKAVQSLAPGHSVTIFVESIQYAQAARVGIPTVETMGPFLITNGASELLKALYPNKVNLVGTELMDQRALANGQARNVKDSLIENDENLSDLYMSCIKKFKSEQIRYESKCYRLLVMRQREANAVAVIKNHMRENTESPSFVIYGAAHPMPMYSDHEINIRFVQDEVLESRNPLLARQIRALRGLNKLLFEQSFVFKDFSNTKQFTLSLADELLKNRKESDDLI